MSIEKRLYAVTMRIEDKDYFIGVFSNRKIMMESISPLNQYCYIDGIKKRKEVNEANIGTSMNGRNLTIYIDDIEGNKIEYMKILQINMNEVNPYYKNKINKKEKQNERF